MLPHAGEILLDRVSRAFSKKRIINDVPGAEILTGEGPQGVRGKGKK